MFLHLSDKKTHTTVPEPTLLSQWIESKLSSNEREQLGLSQTKYYASFIPLFHKNILNREENATRLGTTYGALKIFLTQQPVKKVVNDNINNYAEYYCRRLIARLGKRFLYEKQRKDTTAIKRGYKLFTDEADKYYSRALVEAITKKLLRLTDKSKGQVHEAASISYPIILGILEERFKTKGDKVTFQKIRLHKVQDILLTIEKGLKGSESSISEGKGISANAISLQIKNMEKARKLISEIYEDLK